jgi:prepilin-type N-terminal cleavage/methylation domain-containing protein
MKRFQHGFTMIELLVVIAVIGVLAVAVLSAINPIEQINKGRDTGRRSDSGELINGFERFYASQGYYPWETPATSGTIPLSMVAANAGLGASAVGNLITTNEIKVQLQSRINAYSAVDQLKVNFAGTNVSNVYVCFLPKSTAFLTEAQTRCNTSPVLSAWPTQALRDAACPASCTAGSNVGCMICLP